MRRFLLTLVFVFVGSSFHAQQPPELPQKGAGPGKALDPKEAQKLFKIDDGLRIELVACEPQIESPVAMQFDPDGRLWVVEMRDYPNGPANGEKPAGRIKILEDKDGDGFFETSTIWADNLLFANGLLLWKDGAIVTMAPEIVHLRDTTGGGKADKKERWYAGFAEQNPQLRVSHPILGLDGWIYCANGLRGGKVTWAGLGSKRNVVVDLSGMDFRFDPVTNDYEAITGLGQFGNTFDEWGNRFVCDNRHHLRHVVMENRYIKRNPYLAAPSLLQDVSVLEDGPLSSGGKVYPLSKNWTTSSLHEGRFTAACGVFIYHGQLLGKPRGDVPGTPGFGVPHPGASQIYHGAAFTCEPTGNLVHMEILTPKGATFEAKPHKKGVEFLATTDDWFRPVFLTHGPEGAMYVVDMYRAVIEHPEFMPPELKNRPDLIAGKDKGRIWRIVPKDHPAKTPRPNLSKASLAELVKSLEHAEPWWRQTAQRLLLEKNDKAMIEPLTKLFEGTKSPHAKIFSAWMLERNKSLGDKQIIEMLENHHPRVREVGIRIAESRGQELSRQILEHVWARFGDKDSRVLFQMTLFLGGLELSPIDNLTRTRLLVKFVAQKHHDDKWVRLAIQTALPKVAIGVLENWVQFSTPELESKSTATMMVQEMAALVGAIERFEDLPKVFSMLNNKDKETLRWAGLSGLSTGLERRGKSLLVIAANLPDDKRKQYTTDVENMFSEAAKRASEKSGPLDRRLLCARLLAQASWSTAKEALVPLVEKEASTELRIAALRALAAQTDKEVPDLLIKLWPGAEPSLRREILEAMLRQPARVHVLLDEIEAKRMKASELDPLRTKQLSNHKDAKIRERAKTLLAANLPADRKKVIAEYQAALDMKGDAKNGREIFKKNCSTCHRVAGVGVDVGPDIADTRTKKLDALLFDILVPNAAIDANFVNYVVSTKDGKIMTGLLTAESASSITLVRADKQLDVVLRKDVDEIASTGISLMPDGLEKNINVREMADLLRFLKDWRYLDGSVPVK